MNFEDEARINKKRGLQAAEQEVQEEQISSIYDGIVKIVDIETQFEEKQIGDMPVFMYMPDLLKEYDDAQKKVFFARSMPPKHAYGCDELPICVSANITNKPLKNEQVRMFLEAGKRPLEAMIPQSKVYKSYIIESGDKHVGCMEFVSAGIPANLYNLMLFLSVNDELVMLNIYTFNELKKSVFPYIEQMANSLRIEEATNEADNV